MKPTRIFLDLDDVLNVHTPNALKHVGCRDVPYKPEWGFDIVRAANETHPNAPNDPFVPETFWDHFDREFWADLPKSPYCDWLIEECQQLVGWRNVFILTAPTSDPGCLAGKLDWIHANLPSCMHTQYMIGRSKWACAMPDALLIDDSDANVNAFRRSSGEAILAPRPWNTHHEIGDPLPWIVARLDFLFRRGPCS